MRPFRRRPSSMSRHQYIKLVVAYFGIYLGYGANLMPVFETAIFFGELILFKRFLIQSYSLFFLCKKNYL